MATTTTTSRKRLHQDKPSSTTPRLSVVEFCAVLNGSNNNNDSHDAEDLVQTLHRFVRVVRSERRVALLAGSATTAHYDDNDDDNEDGDFEDSNDMMDDHIKEEPEEMAIDDQQPATSTNSTATSKRFKKDESWKEDTKSYQVPFVGTSQATTIRQQDYGQVVEHTWPCGLLQAYLIKSPMIRELLVFEDNSSSSSSSNQNSFLPRHILRRIPPRSSFTTTTAAAGSKQNDKQKHQHYIKWQSQLLKAYLQALKEVLTAILPAKQQQDTNTLSDAIQQRLITLFQKQVMPIVWQIVEQPTSQSSASSSSDSSSHLACVPIAMQILVQMASVSVACARQVAQHLSTTTKLPVQSSWLSLPSVHPTPVATTADASQESTLTPSKDPTDKVVAGVHEPSTSGKDKKMPVSKQQHATNSAKRALLSQQTCRGALQLVATLCEWKDPGVLAMVMSAGAKERKLPPGLLYTLLRATRLWKSVAVAAGTCSQHAVSNSGVTTTATATISLPSTGFVNVILGRIFRALRIALQGGVLRRRQRLWMDLWSSGGEAWQNLIQLAALTPVTTWNDDEEMTMETEVREQQSQQPNLNPCISSQEAGRLLTLFLTNTNDSPMLLVLQTQSSIGDNNDASLVHTKNQATQQLVRALIYILDHRPLFGRHELMALHAFVLQCLQTSPSLAQPFFRAMTIPELTKPFAVVARWHLISKYLTSGKCQPNIAWSEKLKHVLSKALQSSNAMIVAETLKLILHLLQVHHAQSDITESQSNGEDLTNANKNANVKKQLEMNSFFELQVLLSVRSRWNPFTRKKATSDMLIVVHLCQVLDVVAKMWPRMLVAAKYDWIKLLPPTSTDFMRSHPLLQMRMLRTLQTLLELQLDHETNARFSVGSIRIVLEIMIETRSNFSYVSAAAAQIVLLRFRRLLLNTSRSSDDDDAETLERSACIEYEWECWLQNLTCDSLSPFLAVVENAATKKSSHVIMAAAAWEKAGLPGSLTNLFLSPILLAALLEQPSSTPTFARLTFQVAGKCLLFHRFPLLLAAVISSQDWSNQDEMSYDLPVLSQYAASLIDFDGENDSEQSNMLQSLVVSVFGVDAVHFPPRKEVVLAQWNSFAVKVGPDVAVRLLLHVFVCAKDDARRQSCCGALQTVLLPFIAQRKCNAGKVQPLLRYLYELLTGKVGLLYFDVALLSCPISSTMHSFLEKIVSFLASPLTVSEGKDLLASTPVKRRFLLNGTWKDLLPAPSASRALESLLLTITGINVTLPRALAKLLLDWLLVISEKAQPSVTSIPLNVEFRAWCNLCNQSSTPSLNWYIARQLELSICRDLDIDKDGMVSTHLYALVQRESAEAIIEKCFRSKQAQISDTSDNKSSCFLEAVLNLDVCSMLPIFIHKFIGDDDSGIVSDLFRGHALDCALMLAVDNLEFWDAATIDIVSRKLMQNARDLASVKEKLSFGNCNTLVILTKCMEYENGVLDTLVAFGELVSTLIDCLEIQDDPTRLVILNATNCASLCFGRRQGDDSFENTKRQWMSTVLLQLCNELPKVLRTLHQGEGSDRCVILQHLCLLQYVVKKSDELGFLPDKSTACLGKVLKLCLKHGISDDSTECAVTTSYLKLARVAFIAIERIRLSGSALQFPFIRAPVVFRMIATHSKFQAALELEQEKDATNLPRLELIRLLLCCVSITRGEITFDQTIVKALSSSFKAGVTVLDTAIRRLIQVYTESVAERQEAVSILANDFRWTKESDGSGADHFHTGNQTASREWLLNTLDPDRIRVTLQHFPISDLLYPPALEEEREWPSWDKIHTAQRTEGVDRGGQVRSYNTQSPDVRYSPGFVLPMILACLEDIFPGDHQLPEGGLKEFSDDPSNQHDVEKDAAGNETRAFVEIVKRLCDLGILSFSLGALGSICPLVRKVAAAVLAVILKALRSQAAADLTEWRERPQLHMIVNSVQRSLVIRKAAQKDDISFDSDCVRRLPSVAAVFLARAAAVVGKPGDAMFAPINRFFLKVEVEHGAFQDLTRLPAFISLFCSASDEPPGQFLTERIWAIRLLEEGLLDESGFRHVTACHAPALLQTFLVTVPPNQSGKEGDSNALILRTLCRFLTDGGQNAGTQLICRMGLLSVIRCLLSEESIVLSKCIREVFILIQLSIQGAIAMVNNNPCDVQTLILEVVGLARPILDIAAKLFDTKNVTVTVGNEGDDWLIVKTRRLLDSLRYAAELVDLLDFPIRQNGVSLHSATRLLLRSGLDALLPLCTLPVHVDKSEFSVVEQFCCLAMMTMHEKKESISNNEIESVMRRISILLRSVSWQNSLVLRTSFISCRSLCFRNKKGKLTWTQCMSKLEPVTGTDLGVLGLPELFCS